MTNERRQKKPKAVMASSKSADPSGEHESSAPKSPSEIVSKAADEAGAEYGVWNKVKAIGREIDRNVGGEYERRDDETDATHDQANVDQ
jgi:hypothetical protein